MGLERVVGELVYNEHASQEFASGKRDAFPASWSELDPDVRRPYERLGMVAAREAARSVIKIRRGLVDAHVDWLDAEMLDVLALAIALGFDYEIQRPSSGAPGYVWIAASYVESFGESPAGFEPAAKTNGWIRRIAKWQPEQPF